MSIIYSIICLVNLVLLLAYMALLVFWLKKNHKINVKQRKIQCMLSFCICIAFLCIFLLEVFIDKSWTAKHTLDLLCCILWIICTGFEFSNWKRSKDLFEKEEFLKDLDGIGSKSIKNHEIEYEESNPEENEQENINL